MINFVRWPTSAHEAAAMRVAGKVRGCPHVLLVAGSVGAGTARACSDLDLFLVTTTTDYAMLASMLLGIEPRVTTRHSIVSAHKFTDQVRVSLRITTEDLIKAFFDIVMPITIWRDQPTSSTTKLSEYRVGYKGDVSEHDWNEVPLDGGYVRTVERHRFRDQDSPVLTTETSMLIAGAIISSSGIDEGIFSHLRTRFLSHLAPSDYDAVSGKLSLFSDPRPNQTKSRTCRPVNSA